MSLSFIEQIKHDFNESHLKYYSLILNFDNVWDFAAAKAPKIGTKVQQKGRTITCDPAKTYPCGAVCRSQTKDCKTPIEGQAKNYAGFLELQGKKEGKIKPVDINKSVDIAKLSDSEIESSINDANPDIFKGTVEVDWGSSRGQGKRSGGMVKGSMSDAPKGKKTYIDKYQKLKLNSEDESEIKLSVDAGDNDEKLYLKARSAGFSHKVAMLTSITDADMARNNLTRKDIYKLAREADTGKSTVEKKLELRIVEPIKKPEIVTKSPGSNNSIETSPDSNGKPFRNDKGDFAVTLDKGSTLWQDGYPVRSPKNIDDVSQAIADSNRDEIDIKFKVYSDKEIPKFQKRIEQIAQKAGYTPSDVANMNIKGIKFDSDYVVTLKRGTKKPDLKVVEPTIKPQGQTNTKKPELKVVDGGKGVEPKTLTIVPVKNQEIDELSQKIDSLNKQKESARGQSDKDKLSKEIFFFTRKVG
jgi:hypothetical protein